MCTYHSIYVAQSSMVNMIGFVLLLVSLPVLVIQSIQLYMSLDSHAWAVSGNCKYTAVQVVTGFVHFVELMCDGQVY